MTTRQQIVGEARTWVGTRWQHQAMLKGVATDCIGLIAGVAIELGLPEGAAWAADRRRLGYGREPLVEMLRQACADYMNEIPVALAGLGDVLLMVVPRGRNVQHFAIVSALDPPYVIHAYAPARKVVEARLDDEAAARVRYAFRYRGVE